MKNSWYQILLKHYCYAWPASKETSRCHMTTMLAGWSCRSYKHTNYSALPSKNVAAMPLQHRPPVYDVGTSDGHE
jgi:hypothetical protein